MLFQILAFCISIVSATNTVPIKPNKSLDFNSMVVGNKTLQLLSNRQLISRENGEVSGSWISSDGRYIAYTIGPRGDAAIYVISSAGGKPIKLSATDRDIQKIKVREPEKEPWSADTWEPPKWSPDSKSLAFIASRRIPKIVDHTESGEPIYNSEVWLLSVAPTGESRTSFQIPKESRVWLNHIFWSSNSYRIAAMLYSERNGKRNLSVFDTKNGARKNVANFSGDEDLVGWSKNGKLWYTRSSDDAAELREISLDGKSNKLVKKIVAEDIRDDALLDELTSPDRAYRLVQGKNGTCIKNLASGKITSLIGVPVLNVIGWAPNSRMFLYYDDRTVSSDFKGAADKSGTKRKYPDQLWLASIEPHPLNHLCVALDAGNNALVQSTCSLDCSRIAYVSDAKLFIAELGWREPTCWERLKAQLLLSETDYKELLIQNGKVIGVALERYAAEHEDKYPFANTVEQDIKPYLADRINVNPLPYVKVTDVFLKPGTTMDIFQYFPPTGQRNDFHEKGLTIGVLDAGYGWKVEIYQNGSAEVVTKNEPSKSETSGN